MYLTSCLTFLLLVCLPPSLFPSLPLPPSLLPLSLPLSLPLPGMSEVGIYRVAGVLRDVNELREAFDTDYLKAQVIAFEADIHAVAGLLKKYFRELPDPIFTDALYLNFVQGMCEWDCVFVCVRVCVNYYPLKFNLKIVQIVCYSRTNVQKTVHKL